MKTINKKLMVGAAAAAIALGGVGVKTRYFSGDDQIAGAPFLHPLLIARAACGEENGELSKRRAFFIRAASAYAAEMDAPEADAMLRSDLGAISYDITTAKPEAQAWFNQGLAHTYNFNHGEAVKAFKRAQNIDPDCAMCYWGESFAYGPNINAPMEADAVTPAWNALQKAMSLRSEASAKEQAIINALHYRYSEVQPDDRSKLDNAFADAMDEVAKKYPEDDFIAALAVEANMDTQPWDYWADGGRTPKGRTARSISLLESVLARSPDWPAAIHLYIHMTEASRDPYRALEHADRLGALTPALGHLVHMPSHTYYVTGKFKESLSQNIDAVAADEAYLNSADASVMYEYGYFTHNIHFALTSAQMAGDGATALAMSKKLDEKLPVEMAAAAPFVQPIKAAPYYAMVQFASPEEILALESPGDALPFLKATWHYARGEAYAKMGDAEAAMKEAEAISAIAAEADLSPLVNGNVPAPQVLDIARLTVIARASAAQGDLSSAIEAMEEATAIQEDIPYMEPPWWYYPSAQTLAAYLLEDGQTERAEQLFIETLTESPNNAWVLYGLAESYKRQGDKNAAKYATALFKDAWIGGRKTYPSLAQL
ncbi:tetratricopeptide repeat protein [Hyphococcus sp.]|uniref:tetratricopeptide repeat protein n=1 Tax=Hyphococcus sp. TaxID=2038636 RepID=UPI0035C6AE5C